MDFFVGNAISIMDKLKNVLAMEILNWIINANSGASKKRCFKMCKLNKKKKISMFFRSKVIAVFVDRCK